MAKKQLNYVIREVDDCGRRTSHAFCIRKGEWRNISNGTRFPGRQGADACRIEFGIEDTSVTELEPSPK